MRRKNATPQFITIHYEKPAHPERSAQYYAVNYGGFHYRYGMASIIAIKKEWPDIPILDIAATTSPDNCTVKDWIKAGARVIRS